MLTSWQLGNRMFISRDVRQREARDTVCIQRYSLYPAQSEGLRWWYRVPALGFGTSVQ
jgi:hypothetical protein